MAALGSTSNSPDDEGNPAEKEIDESSAPSMTNRPEQWVDEHGDYLFRYAWARVHDQHAAEDLVQQTLLAAWKSQKDFAGKASEKTWLTGILRHKIVDYVRKKSREYSVTDQGHNESELDKAFDDRGFWNTQAGKEPRDWGLDPGEALSSKEFMQILEQCLETLPERMRTGFVMRELEGIEPQKIRDFLEVSPSNVSVILHRARKQLRGCIEKNWLQEETKRS